MSAHNWSNPTTFGNALVQANGTSYSMSFDNNAIVKIEADFANEFMTVNVIMDPDLEGEVVGLMGEFTIKFTSA